MKWLVSVITSQWSNNHLGDVFTAHGPVHPNTAEVVIVPLSADEVISYAITCGPVILSRALFQ